MAGHRFNPAKANKLIDPKRKEWITPEEAIRLLDIQDDDTITDLGAGNGYFTLPMALKTNKEVIAVDIEPQMLDLLLHRAKEQGLENIQYVESNLENIQIENDRTDKILVAFVIHEVKDIGKAMEEMKRIKKKDGKILILEWQPVEAEMGPPLHERIPPEELKVKIEDAGLSVSVHHLNEQVYGLVIT